MLEKQKEKYRNYIQRLSQDTDVSNADARQAIYAKLQKANEDMISKNRDSFGDDYVELLRRALSETIAENEARYDVGIDSASDPDPIDELHQSTAADAPAHDTGEYSEAEPVAQAEPHLSGMPAASKPRLNRTMLIGLALGALATIVILYGLTASGIASVSFNGQQIARNNYVTTAYADQEPQVQVAREYLVKVRDAVIAMQKKDAAAVTKVAGSKLVPLKALDRKLAAELPKSLPTGTQASVRANDKGYKILLNSPLCSTVELADVALVDPVRKRVGLGCTHFGMWNAGGAKY
ncbi:hypothetical protein QBK99_10505 [Corticibacterium sp. UT-5YL-CI-8]|nr:hypothetical protein [Tianweitania sp. UT-5YL-CI-8]